MASLRVSTRLPSSTHPSQDHKSLPRLPRTIFRTHNPFLYLEKISLTSFLRRQTAHAPSLSAAAHEATADALSSRDRDENAEARDSPTLVPYSEDHHVIVNFYILTDIPDPAAELAAHQAFVADLDLRGRIYLSWQGINAQYSALSQHAEAYAQWCKSRPGCESLTWRTERVPGPMFPRLKLKFRQSLISMAGGTKHLPVGKEGYRAEHVSPALWRAMLRAAALVRDEGEVKVVKEDTMNVLDDAVERDEGGATACTSTPSSAADLPLPMESLANLVVLDLRNDYEWDVGHFAGAARPAESQFNETPTVASGSGSGGSSDSGSEEEEKQEENNFNVPAPLRNVPKDTPVMMYCTGGIRCDVYSAHLRQAGFERLYSLEGGVHNYFASEGSVGWNGSLFVFDGRVAVPAESPAEAEARWNRERLAAHEPGREPETKNRGVIKGQVNSCFASGEASPFQGLPAATGCAVCGGIGEAPPINCANIDCNNLFIGCRACKEALMGCCCPACVEAPRLRRPTLLTGGNYSQFTAYVDEGNTIRTGRIGRRRARRKLEATRGQEEAQVGREG